MNDQSIQSFAHLSDAEKLSLFEQTLSELNQRNRELEMEAALEKVRSASLAMQKSDELKNVIIIVFETLKELGLVFQNAGIQLFTEGSNDIMQWVAAPHLLSAPVLANLPSIEKEVEESEIARNIWIAKEEGKHICNKHYSFEEKNRFFAYAARYNNLDQIPENAREAQMQSPGYTHSLVAEKHSALWVDSYTGQTISAEGFDVLKRTAHVFEQAYTRFLDLQKAEKHAREALIEAALEKVRSRSLAMHHSNELVQVVASLFDRLVELGFSFDGALIFLFDKAERNIHLWIATVQLPAPVKIDLPFDEEIKGNAIYTDLWNAVEKGSHIFNKMYSGETKNEYFRYVQKYNESRIPEPVRRLELEKESWTAYLVAEKNSIIGFDSWSGPITSITDEDFRVLQRFAKVFEQAYVRFLDLQRAEAQAREAKIETALERVRARAMAMHVSEELKDVVKELRKQIGLLGQKELNTCVIQLYDESQENIQSWVSQLSENSEEITEFYATVPKKGLLIQDEALQAYYSGRKDYTLLNEKEKLKQWIIFLKKTYPDAYAIIAKSYRESNPDEVPMYWSFSDFNGGSLLMVTLAPPTDVSKTLLRRFANVFGLAYRRFTDLKQAEAQAKEAKIESALERVRARTMAMQKSIDLLVVANVLREQFGGLGQPELESSIVHIYKDDTPTFEAWYAYSPPHQQAAGIINGVAVFQKDGTEWAREVIARYQSGEPEYTIIGNGEKIKEWYGALEKEAPATVEYDAEGLLLVPELLYYHFARFSGGALLMISNKEPSREACELQQRAALVFELAYTRFLDLQKAEAQTREAQIEAALERVRAKAMGMHSTEDLADTIGIFYKELQAFSITPRRCGVGLLDREERMGELFTWNTTEQGESLQLVGRLKMEGHSVLEKVYENWQKQAEYHPVLRGSEITAYYNVLRPQMAFPDYTHDVVQYGYFFFFKEGGVYAWTEKEMKEEELQIYRRFTSVLSLTYKRYRDLQRAEAQALRAEQDLIEIKAARKKAEDALAALKATQQQLIQREKMASLGELTAGIAHEIQNPLNFVNNFSEVNKELVEEIKEEAERRNTDEVKVLASEVLSNLDKVVHHGKRADAIVKGMLQHSRISTGPKVPTDINNLVAEYLRLSYHGLRTKNKTFNATIETHFDPGLSKMNLIPEEIGRVLLNLFNNAFYAVNERKKKENGQYEPFVQVVTQKLQNKNVVKVKDNGTGIPEKLLDKIFQPFFTTKPTGEGTGLGLSLSYDIITKVHGGKLRVESKEGEGSEFVIQLPVGD